MKYYYLLLISVFLGACDRYNPVNDQIYEVPNVDNWVAETSLNALQDAVKNYPESAENHYKLALYYLQTRRDTLALENIKQTLQLDSTHTKYYFALAQIYQKLNQFDQALPAVLKSQNADETNFETLVLAGEICYQKKEYDNAIKYLNKALKISTLDARVYFWKGNVEIARYDSANALKNLNLALHYKPNYFEAYNSFSELFTRYELFNTALRYADKGLKINAKYAPLYFNKAEAFRLKRYFEDSAAVNYEKAFQLKPDLYWASYHLGVYNFEKGKTKTAQKYFESTLKYSPDLAKAHYYLGMCLRYANKKPEALKELGTAIRLNPKDLIAGEMYWQVKNDIYQEDLLRREDSTRRAYYKWLEEQRKKEEEALKKLYQK